MIPPLPGVVTKKESVIREKHIDMAAPSAENKALKAPAVRANAVASCMKPMKLLSPCTPNMLSQLRIGLLAMTGAML
jgi:hypothetical protein